MTGTEARGRQAGPWRIAGWGAVAMILLLPLLGMLVTDEVNWTPFDFAVAATLLVGAGGLCELAAMRSGSRVYRAAVAVAVIAAVALVWVNGAVGIIGSEDNPANLMFAGVLAVGIVGAVLARGGTRGMARALVAMALAQVAVFVVALAAGLGFAGPATAAFGGLWLLSAWLFQRAAEQAAAR